MHAISSDFRVDLSFHALSVLVAGAIAVALIWHLIILLTPLSERRLESSTAGLEVTEPGPPAWAAMGNLPEPAVRALAAESLVATHVTVFRCDADGRVTYTDRPCERGGMRVLRLRKT
jgi:hypothetical protein